MSFLPAFGTLFLFSLLVGCTANLDSGRDEPAKKRDPQELRGRISDGSYVNKYFNLQIDFGDGWESVERTQIQQAAENNGFSAGLAKSMPLALVHAPGKTYGASLGVGFEEIPVDQRVPHGKTYLENMMKILHKRPQPPRDVVEEQPIQIAGRTFNCLSLKRDHGGLEVAMLIYASVDENYAIVLTGSYINDQGKQKLEELVSSISTITER